MLRLLKRLPRRLLRRLRKLLRQLLRRLRKLLKRLLRWLLRLLRQLMRLLRWLRRRPRRSNDFQQEIPITRQATEGRGVTPPALLVLALIHPSAWKKNSAKFAYEILNKSPSEAARMASKGLPAA